MIFALLVSSVVISSASMMVTHPISLVAVILTQTLLICLISPMVIASSWFSYITFLIFMGGVMVLFIYIASLASNENFLINSNTFIFFVSITSVFVFILMLDSNFSLTAYSDLNFLNYTMKMYSSMTTAIMLSTMLYLLFTLIIVVEIIKHYQAPLRSSH